MACRRRAPKGELVRMVGGGDGKVLLDPSGSAPGRGAYVCSNVGCFDRALERRRLAGALRTGIDDEQMDELRREFA